MKRKQLIEWIERAVFGATAEERVVAALERLADEPTPETDSKEDNREDSDDGGR